MKEVQRLINAIIYYNILDTINLIQYLLYLKCCIFEETFKPKIYPSNDFVINSRVRWFRV